MPYHYGLVVFSDEPKLRCLSLIVVYGCMHLKFLLGPCMCGCCLLHFS